jgi:hypothetical protein
MAGGLIDVHVFLNVKAYSFLLASYLCPGLHDRDSRQDIRRQTFRDVLARRLVIPLFQGSIILSSFSTT